MNIYDQLCEFAAVPEGATIVAIFDPDGLKTVRPISAELINDPTYGDAVSDAFTDLLRARMMRKERGANH